MKPRWMTLLFLLVAFAGHAQVLTDSTEDFVRLKGKLVLPVDHFTKLITDNMRRQKLLRKGISYGNSRELTIQSDTTMHVKTPAAGTVLAVFEVDGTMAIVINHGDYYFTYSNMDAVLINKGDLVEAGQELGIVINKSMNEVFELDVSMMDKTRTYHDPYPWFITARHL